MDSEKRQQRLTARVSAFGQRLASTGLALSIQQLLQTVPSRVAYYDVTVDPARPEYDEHCLFVFWHENLSILLPQWSRCPVTLLVSQHRDAHWLKHAADFWGFNVVRGSTTRGGSQAIRRLRKLRDHTSLAITPDGPQGPRRTMAMGPLFLASRLQMPLVPVGVGFDRPWRLNTWDRFAVPRPFARARIVMGPKLRISPTHKREQLERCRQGTERLLNELTGFAGRWAEDGGRVLQENPFIRSRRCASLELAAGCQQPGHSPCPPATRVAA